MRLDRIVLREIRLPLVEPFRISSGEMTDRRILLCELTDADGASVWSECVVDDLPNYSAETLDTAWPTIARVLAPRLLGRTLGSPSEVHAILEADVRGHQMAKAALEMGAWGLEATRQRLPLARLIGGTRDAIATGISLGIQPSVDRLIEKVRAALLAGYQKVKIKIAPGRDVAWVRAVREAVGPDVIAPTDVYTALEKGVVDGVAFPSVGIVDMKWSEVAKYYMQPFFGISTLEIFMNQNAFNRLSADD